jgi:hypothetical protein
MSEARPLIHEAERRCPVCCGTGEASDTYSTTVEAAAAVDRFLGYPPPRCGRCKGTGRIIEPKENA